MKDRELLEYIAAQVGNLTVEVKEIKGTTNKLESGLGKLENQVTKSEIEHGRKLDVLFDGYKQNAEVLNEIWSEVVKHEEVILKRVK